MGIFDFLKQDDDNNEADDKSLEPYTELSTGLDDYQNPTWGQVESAVKDVTEEEDSFATLAFHNRGLEVDTLQCIKFEEGYTIEALPAQESENFGMIYHLDGLSYEETVKRFEEFYETQKVSGYKNFSKDSFE
ncbi:hypothetical protein [Jeotgalicoccus coquinae]|uniref:Uncharacterized protein n=1 Tax=Jeotgalicoccus coquinae TaxID=709509 RepID=A0A6V7R190_9STAP|nr:hypothetical protein [Jeotgalicoccus coquinae]MBB6423755.1 hypothetical protein [Jeotgalicoccus coquinae]CAD2070824.1 hypothetical protein JEOCOQ751_00052 [Jeotgalicoccus coquinae]